MASTLVSNEELADSWDKFFLDVFIYFSNNPSLVTIQF